MTDPNIQDALRDAFGAFTGAAVFEEMPTVIEPMPASAPGQKKKQKKGSNSAATAERLARTLICTNVDVNAEERDIEKAIMHLVKGLFEDTVNNDHTSTPSDKIAVTTVFFRACDFEKHLQRASEKKAAAAKKQFSSKPGATKLAFIRFNVEDPICPLIEKYSGRLRLNNRHIFMYPGTQQHAQLHQPRSLFISGIKDRSMDIEVLLTYLEKHYGFLLTNIRIFKDVETGKRLSYCIVELAQECWPPPPKIWMTEFNLPGTNCVCKIMKCVSEKKVKKAKERRERALAVQKRRLGKAAVNKGSSPREHDFKPRKPFQR
ncbi:hypothetical protein GMRT_10322 [Giardia muris]|uniref:Uncharacterized protein n=1 Tax=Giardia muris TaxID=5742 RepID=A0A4Z1T9Q7_GIAMU|nr:hypothetical protein GMRT_10322 [Giardia muris]|eukprot:TNJ29897.1 hypothetical protein GMRT_10322 [Giardia muris]